MAFASPVRAQTVLSAANQTFVVGAPSAAISALTITDAVVPTITVANDIRIRIPAGLNMTWDPTITTATITGTGALSVSTTVSYGNGNLDLIIDVTANFLPSSQIVVSGLRFTAFSATSPASRLGLITGGAGGAVVDPDNRTKTIVAPSIVSAANQTLVVGAAATTISPITITDASTASFTAANDIRVRIPPALNMTWDPSVTVATIGGGSAGRVSTTVSYANGNRDLVINVTLNFAAGGQIVVSGLRFMNFTATSPATSLQLISAGASGSVAATDTRPKTIVATTLSSAANQVFVVGGAATAVSTITVTEAAAASITAANDIRIRIPAALNMTWDPTAVTATIGGAAAAKVSPTVSYANGNRDLVLNVTTDFVAGDVITVSGLSFTSFTGTSPATSLELIIGGAGGSVADTDDKSIEIAAAGVTMTPNSATTSRLPSNGVTYTATQTVTNTGSQADSYDFLGSRRPGGTVTLVSISGPGVTQAANPDSARLTNLAAGAAASVTLTYSVASVAVGTIDTLVVIARSTALGTVRDSAKLAIVVAGPSLTFSKTASPGGTPPPGSDISYTATVANVGTWSAVDVVLMDLLPASMQFQVGSVVTSMPGGIGVALEYSNDAGASWTYAPASGSCGAPVGYDGCVQGIRWRLLAALPFSAPGNTGSVQFVARIP